MKNLTIRMANEQDIPRLLEIYGAARKIMHESGNFSQWSGSYPGEEDARRDMEQGILYCVTAKAGRIVGAFTLLKDPEPTYTSIREGQWLDTTPYGTIHRIASDGSVPGIFHEAIAFAQKQWDHLRIDTHEDNVIMRHVIPKEGFIYCGIITLKDGSDRLAYEWVRSEK